MLGLIITRSGAGTFPIAIPEATNFSRTKVVSSFACQRVRGKTVNLRQPSDPAAADPALI